MYSFAIHNLSLHQTKPKRKVVREARCIEAELRATRIYNLNTDSGISTVIACCAGRGPAKSSMGIVKENIGGAFEKHYLESDVGRWISAAARPRHIAPLDDQLSLRCSTPQNTFCAVFWIGFRSSHQGATIKE